MKPTNQPTNYLQQYLWKQIDSYLPSNGNQMLDVDDRLDKLGNDNLLYQLRFDLMEMMRRAKKNK